MKTIYNICGYTCLLCIVFTDNDKAISVFLQVAFHLLSVQFLLNRTIIEEY